VDRIAAKYGRRLHECPITKYIADLMMGDIIIGGEESSGIGYSRYLPSVTDPQRSLLAT
jgi:phosphoglucomutase